MKKLVLVSFLLSMTIQPSILVGCQGDRDYDSRALVVGIAGFIGVAITFVGWYFHHNYDQTKYENRVCELNARIQALESIERERDPLPPSYLSLHRSVSLNRFEQFTNTQNQGLQNVTPPPPYYSNELVLPSVNFQEGFIPGMVQETYGNYSESDSSSMPPLIPLDMIHPFPRF